MMAELGRILTHLRGHGLSANELTLFARYLEQNHQASLFFLNIKGDQEMINFIRELDLTPYKDNPSRVLTSLPVEVREGITEKEEQVARMGSDEDEDA
ncbi:hypothetical protein CTI12_AA243560 [Artemisia annua]|uniref:Uncharacterized protein n=1 Tax=Artemisia annua TaxID=35608 RepID=A0A2U1MXL8_ARTAN|nr:hypothetical protein CTI12_AA243560 [Artemisia annua]